MEGARQEAGETEHAQLSPKPARKRSPFFGNKIRWAKAVAREGSSTAQSSGLAETDQYNAFTERETEGNMTENMIKLAAILVVSAVLLLAGLGVIIFGDASADLEKIAAGWVGLVAGYWFK